MGLIFRVIVAAIVALVAYFVLTALIVFAHSALIFGLLAVVIFLVVAFGAGGGPTTPAGGRRWGW